LHISRQTVSFSKGLWTVLDKINPRKDQFWELAAFKMPLGHSPLLLSKNDLTTIISEWCMDIPLPKCIGSDIYTFLDSNQSELCFQINYNDVARYIETVLLSDDKLMSESKSGFAPENHIQYASASLFTKLVDECGENQDLECIVVTARLIISGLFPPPELCHSILKIFISYSGAELTDHILSTTAEAAIRFGENLARLSIMCE
jgi:hypothetical protein